MQKGGKRKKSAWMQHVAKTMAEMPNVALRDVLKAASKTYKKGSSVAGAVLVKTKHHRKRRRKTRQKTRRKKHRKARRKVRRKTRRKTRRRTRRRHR